VETDTDQVEVQFLGSSDEILTHVDGASKLGGESAYRVGVVGNNTKNQFRFRIAFSNLNELVTIIECHHFDTARFSILDVRSHLSGIGIDNSLGGNTTSKDLLNLRSAGTVKVDVHAGKGLDDGSVGVALHGVEGLDTGEGLVPLLELLKDASKINEIEGRFAVSGLVGQLFGDDLFDGLVDGFNIILVYDIARDSHSVGLEVFGLFHRCVDRGRDLGKRFD